MMIKVSFRETTGRCREIQLHNLQQFLKWLCLFSGVSLLHSDALASGGLVTPGMVKPSCGDQPPSDDEAEPQFLGLNGMTELHCVSCFLRDL